MIPPTPARPLCLGRSGPFVCALARGHEGACLTADGRGVIGASLAVDVEPQTPGPVSVSIRWKRADEGPEASRLVGSSDLFGGFYFVALRVHEEPASDLTQRAWDEEDDTELAKAAEDLRRDGVALVGGGGYYRCEDDRLSQPCPECGYQYGSAWLLEPLPEALLLWLESRGAQGSPCLDVAQTRAPKVLAP